MLDPTIAATKPIMGLHSMKAGHSFEQDNALVSYLWHILGKRTMLVSTNSAVQVVDKV